MKKSKDFCIIGIGCLIFFMILYYVIFIAKGYYHSDCTDTIMWAQAAYDAGALVNHDFMYAGIMPFGGQLIMLPLVALFGVGMKAQIMGMTIFFELFVIAIIFMCRSLKFNGKWISVTVAFVLIILSSSAKLREIFWGHIIYYSLGVFSLMIGLAIIFKSINAEEDIDGKNCREACGMILKKQKWLYMFLFIWTVFSSANGVQSMTLYGLPILGALIAERFFDFNTKFLNKKNLNRYFLTVVMILGIVCGLLLGKLVVGDVVASYADGYSTFSESGEWVDNFLQLIPEFFTLIGVKISDGMLIYSFDGILNLLRIICGIILLAVPVIMAFMYSRFEEVSYRIMILIHHFVAILLLLGWVFGRLSSANWRLSPMVATSAVLCIMFVRWILRYAKYKRPSAIIIIPVICMSLIVTKDMFTMEKQTQTNAGLNELAQYLEDNNLKYGYATFWYANIITMLSDSDVKVRTIKIEDEGYMMRYYQTNMNWYENATGYSRYFVIFTESEYNEKYIDNGNYEEPQEILECGNYKIMVYDHNIF